ncbi:MAG: hypothetical protein GTO18_03195 [Anaerolineales bacterium]|nr:hypothetical protein [Anaerolineales bacterium]
MAKQSTPSQLETHWFLGIAELVLSEAKDLTSFAGSFSQRHVKVLGIAEPVLSEAKDLPYRLLAMT